MSDLSIKYVFLDAAQQNMLHGSLYLCVVNKCMNQVCLYYIHSVMKYASMTLRYIGKATCASETNHFQANISR